MSSHTKLLLYSLSGLRPEICEKYFLPFTQKMYKLIQLSLSQFVYFLFTFTKESIFVSSRFKGTRGDKNQIFRTYFFFHFARAQRDRKARVK